MLRRLLRHSSIYLVGDLLRRSISLIMLPLYTHYLSPSDYGLLELLDLTVTVAVLLFGLSAAGDSMVRIYHEQESESQRSAVISTVLWLVFLVGSATGILGICSAGQIRTLISTSADIRLIQFSFFTMSFGALNEVLMLFLQLKRRPLLFVTVSLIQTFALISLNIYFLAYQHMALWGFVLSKCVVLSISAAILLVITIKEVSWKFHFGICKDVLRFGLPLILSSIAIFTIHFSDRFFISRTASMADLGVYSLAYKFGMLVSVLVGAPFSAVWNTTVYAELHDPEWPRQFVRAITYLAFLSALVAVALSLFARPVLHLTVASSYYGAIALVPLIAVAYAVRTLGDVFRTLLYLTKRSRLFSLVCALCAAANLALNSVLIPSFGITGAAWATCITWCLYLFLCWRLALQSNPIPVHIRSLATVAAGTIAVLLVDRIVVVHSSLAQWVFAGSALTAFIFVLYVSRALPASERECVLLYTRPAASKLLSAVGLSSLRAR